ncbi:MAG: YidC/Oxa1 family membrane protein insertase [Candidatus Paceibacterota bacterium]
MLSNIWNTILYGPLLNALAFLVSIIPGGDIGIAVIILTLFVKTVLFPLSQRSIESQIKMNLLAPELKKIKDSGVSKEEQAKQTFELYKHHKTNPFSGCLLIFIQIPIIFALYYVFLKGINLESGLYSFIHAPEHINMLFLGILDISQKNILILAILAGISQYFQASLMPKPAISEKIDKSSFQENMTKSMQTQMKYVFPFIIAFIAYSVSGAVALYWITSNIFAIGQQMYANKKKRLAIEAVNNIHE